MKSSAGRREFLVDAVHLFVLVGFGIAQPLYDLLGRNAEFFVAHRSEAFDLLLLVFALSLAIPLLLVLLEVAVGLLGRLPRRILHAVLVALLVAIVALPPLKKLPGLSGSAVLAAAALAGCLFALGYVRFRPLRLFLTVLSPAILFFPAMFLFVSPAGKVMRPVRAVAAPALGLQSPPPIVMVVFDEFSSVYLMNERGEIQADRFPNFAALAQNSYWFRNATASVDSTTYSLGSILTGRYPPDRRMLPTVGDYPDNLFTLLSNTYDLNVQEPVTAFCPVELCQSDDRTRPTKRFLTLSIDAAVVLLNAILPGQTFAWLPSVSQGWGGFVADPRNFAQSRGQAWLKIADEAAQVNRAEIFRQFVNSLQSASNPSLNFLHILLPHIPLTYLASGKIYPPMPLRGRLGSTGNEWSSDEQVVLIANQRYLLQLQFVDSLIGELVATLKERDLFDRALLIVTADHGVSFRVRDSRRALSRTNFAEIMSVPLFVKLPGQIESQISDKNVQLTDLISTIGDVLEIEIPWETDGPSMFDESPVARQKVMIHTEVGKKERREFSAELNEKYDAARGQTTRFGKISDPYGLYRTGPFGYLVGTSTSAIRTRKSEIAVSVDQIAQFVNIDPAASYLPAYVSGQLEASRVLPPPLDIAIAVNGTISAVTRTFERGRDLFSFEAMLPESTFVAGRNAVSVYVVSGGVGELSLMETQISGAVDAARFLSNAEGEQTLNSPEGTPILVSADAVRGWTEFIRHQPPLLTFEGWAVDAKRKLPARRIFVFGKDRLLYSAVPNVHRPDVAQELGTGGASDCGFRFSIPVEMFNGLEGREVRLFALSYDNVATEMKYDQKSEAILESTLAAITPALP